MRAVEDSSTIDRRGLLGLYVLYQLTWTIAMFYAWPEGYRLPPIAPPAPAMIQIASCLFFAAALFGDQLVVRILLASAYAAMAFEGGVVALARDGEIELDMVLFPVMTGALHALASWRLAREARKNCSHIEPEDEDDAALERFLRTARVPQLVQPAVGRGRAQGRRGEDDVRFDGRARAVDASHARAPQFVVHAVHAEHGFVALNCGTLPL